MSLLKQTQSSTEQPGKHPVLNNLAILNRVRLIAINAQVVLVMVATGWLQIELPLIEIVATIGIAAIVQWIAIRQSNNNGFNSSRLLLIYLLIDSLILSILIYLTGGANNPFIYLLLLYVAFASWMLKPRALVFYCLIALSLYSLLNNYNLPLKLADASPLNAYHLHMAGMWINFILTVVLIAVFGLLAKRSLLEQESENQKLRERQLKDEQLLSIGIMSAGAAHELGTPLSTMAVIVDDLQHAFQQVESQNAQESKTTPSDYADDLKVLRSQIEICRSIMRSLSEKSQSTKLQLNEASSNTTLFKDQLTKIIEHWLVYRPQIKLEQNWSSVFNGLNYQLPISIEQAIINLLDNAADASLENNVDQISVDFALNESEIKIKILDNGQGLSQPLGDYQKQPIHTEKKDGLGWGLFLSNASIERFGGKVHLQEVQNKGMLTTIVLPITR